MIENIEVFTQNSIRVRGCAGTIYVDPFQMKEEPYDADFILITHEHYDHFSRDDIAKVAGDHTVLVVPEKMRGEAANNLLKTLEEPVPGAIFILVSNDTSTILPTILSRVQNIAFHALPAEVIAEALVQRNGLEQNTAMQIARISCGSYLKALKTISVNNEADTYFKNFTQLMRLAYSRNLVALKGWCDEVASWSREKQKSFLEYCQNMLRENFVYNFHRPELNFMNEQELQFATKFSSFINERNIVEFAHEFSVAQRDIEQNVYSRNVLFNMALQCIILIRK